MLDHRVCGHDPLSNLISRGALRMPIHRRKFLALALGAAPAVAGGTLAWRLGQPGDSEVTRRSRALGTDVSLTVLGAPRVTAERALDAAFAELETVERVMSLYRPDSDVCRLNRERIVANPHPYLREILARAEDLSRLTRGAFDITVQPLWATHATAQREGRLPTENELAASQTQVDWRALDIRGPAVRLRAPATAITLNGIAQGYAADRAIDALRRHAITHAVVNTGEVGTIGRRPTGEAWQIGVQHPRLKDAFVAVAGLDGRALSTSGDYATSFTSDFSTNHVFDPKTGRSPDEVASVSIVAPTATLADALSTAAMVLGPRETLALLEQMPNIDALFVLKTGRVIRTHGFPELPQA